MHLRRHAIPRIKTRLSRDLLLKRITTTYRSANGGKLKSSRWVPASSLDIRMERLRRRVRLALETK